MSLKHQRASELALCFCKSAASSLFQSLWSPSRLWYTGELTPRAALGSVIGSLHRSRPHGVTLMTLPPEVRGMILAKLLVAETVVKPYDLTIPLSPTILQACKQLNGEGTHLLYTRNLFWLDEPMLAVEFLFRDYHATRSTIREITIVFAAGTRTLDRRDHPTQDHVALRYQDSYRDLRELATSMHQWSIALSMLPAGIQTITVFPYSFFDCCNHTQQGWPLTSAWFCPGCGLQQFCKDNKLEDFLPFSSTQHIRWEQGPQMVIAYEPIFNRHLGHQQLRARRRHLFEVAKGRVNQIGNGP